MAPERNYYTVLGLPKTASVAEIKKRYRELVRKYHPDVVKDKAAGEKAFLQITEAYKTLVDPEKRRAYDYTLVEKTQPVRPQASAPRQPGPARPQQPNRQSEQVRKLVKDAEMAFIRRRLDQAAQLCKQAVRLDMTCARAHTILGDIYRLRKLNNHAINEYNYAIQFNPSDRESQAKMEKLINRTSPISFSWETPDGSPSPVAMGFSIIGWAMAFLLLFLIYIFPGDPIPWFARYHIPIVQNWSWNLVGFMFADGALVGLLLSVRGAIAHPDDELIFETGGRGWAIVPTAFLLLLFAPAFFLGAAVLYLLLAFAQDTISKSILKVFAAVMSIVLFSAVMYPKDAMSVVLMGGNVAFVGALAGWYLGAMLRSEN